MPDYLITASTYNKEKNERYLMANRSLATAPADQTILVTGGAGFIGSHTCVELLDQGYNVVVVDDLSNSSEEAIRRIGEITGKPEKLTFYQVNILDREALDKVFAAHDIDAIIHFARIVRCSAQP